MGGSFNTVNSTNRNGLARLNSDGSLDGSFNPATGGYPLALQPDGNNSVAVALPDNSSRKFFRLRSP